MRWRSERGICAVPRSETSAVEGLPQLGPMFTRLCQDRPAALRSCSPAPSEAEKGVPDACGGAGASVTGAARRLTLRAQMALSPPGAGPLSSKIAPAHSSGERTTCERWVSTVLLKFPARRRTCRARAAKSCTVLKPVTDQSVRASDEEMVLRMVSCRACSASEAPGSIRSSRERRLHGGVRRPCTAFI